MTRRESWTHLEEEGEILSKVVYDLFAEELGVGDEIILERLARLEEGRRAGRVGSHPQLHNPNLNQLLSPTGSCVGRTHLSVGLVLIVAESLAPLGELRDFGSVLLWRGSKCQLGVNPHKLTINSRPI